jgi:ankyrin repeat protein
MITFNPNKLTCSEFNTQRCTLQDGTTALQIAGRNGHAEVVQLLLDSRADANLADKVHWAATLSAIHQIRPRLSLCSMTTARSTRCIKIYVSI